MVKSANMNGLLDNDNESSKYQNMWVKCWYVWPVGWCSRQFIGLLASTGFYVLLSQDRSPSWKFQISISLELVIWLTCCLILVAYCQQHVILVCIYQLLVKHVSLYRVKEKLQALLNVDRQFTEDDFEKVTEFPFFYSLHRNLWLFHVYETTETGMSFHHIPPGHTRPASYDEAVWTLWSWHVVFPDTYCILLR